MSNELQLANPDSTVELLRFAVEKGASVETIERMMAVRRELMAERAKSAFDAALASFQADCPVIERRKQVMNKDGRSVRYHYAPLDDIVAQVKPLLQRHGFSYSLDTKVESGWVEAICIVTHSGGHSSRSSFRVPIDPTAFMNEQQKFASALTFAKRYTVCNAFGILTGDEDVDGRTAKEKPAGPSKLQPDDSAMRSLARELWDALKPVRGPEHNWQQANIWLWDKGILAANEEAPNLTAARFSEAIKKAKERVSA